MADPADYSSIFEIPIPGDLTGDEWHDRLVQYHGQGRTVADVLEIAEHLSWKQRRSRDYHLYRQEKVQQSGGRPVLMPVAVMSSKGHIEASREDAYLVRNALGRPLLRLIPDGDRLAIWSPVNGGALINPRGPGLRRFGMVTTPGARQSPLSGRIPRRRPAEGAQPPTRSRTVTGTRMSGAATRTSGEPKRGVRAWSQVGLPWMTGWARSSQRRSPCTSSR